MVKVKEITTQEGKEINPIILYHEDVGVTAVFIKNGESGEPIGHPLLDVDVKGSILEIEVIMPVGKWQMDHNITIPEYKKNGLVFIEQEENDTLDRGEEVYYTNKNKDFLYIQIEKEKPKQSVEIAKNIILDVTDKDKLGGIWILDLPKNIP